MATTLRGTRAYLVCRACGWRYLQAHQACACDAQLSKCCDAPFMVSREGRLDSEHAETLAAFVVLVICLSLLYSMIALATP
jgi:hypothetical protein